MELHPSYSAHNSNIRSFSGCWTCRLRRKKCDEKHPMCSTCAALEITCHYSYEKPDWMDGGKRQEQMAERLKREVKEKKRWRRGDRTVPLSQFDDVVVKDRNGRKASSESRSGSAADPASESINTSPDMQSNVPSSESEPCGPGCSRSLETPPRPADIGPSDALLLTFYIEQVLPFLFPFYRPSLLQGGKSWILEMVLNSPVVRRATLCQSSYFFALAQTVGRYFPCNKVLGQTQDAFEVLRRALEVLRGPADISEHVFGAVRVLASIMQVQRFELAVLSFQNCHTHLNAGLALFKQLLGTVGSDGRGGNRVDFNQLLTSLGPSSWSSTSLNIDVPSPEQSALRFSAALLIFDDIIASTVLQEPPKLYDILEDLIGGEDCLEPPVNLEAVVGCANLVLLQVAKIASLDSWKQQCNRTGEVDHIKLMHHADLIENALRTRLMYSDERWATPQEKKESLLDIFGNSYCEKAHSHARQVLLVTRVWAHAALIYISVVRSGWLPAKHAMGDSVENIVKALTTQISSPALLRAMVWPFCVAGCMATPAQQEKLRELVDALEPPSVFLTVHKAFDIMESVWKKQDAEVQDLDFATCFRSQGDLVLLV
ncbi:fungal-specific transcription factor domain-containing protein [Pestalotiopsis sp. NC0098]|nr:fungal-specific transcription factor domain-containing protein [Pestalotiopsis sp. NC0098]